MTLTALSTTPTACEWYLRRSEPRRKSKKNFLSQQIAPAHALLSTAKTPQPGVSISADPGCVVLIEGRSG